MQQAIKPAKVDERAVLGEILDHSSEDRAFFQMLQRLSTLFLLRTLEQFLAGNNNVAALFIELDDGDFDRLSLHAVEVANRAQVHLRAGQKSVRAHNVHGQAALDSIDHHALNRLLLVMSFFDLIPGMNALRLLMRKVNVTFLSLALLAHYVDFIAGLDFRLALMVEHFRKRQHAFRLRANVHNHVRSGELQYRTLNDAVVSGGLFGFSGEGL